MRGSSRWRASLLFGIAVSEPSGGAEIIAPAGLHDWAGHTRAGIPWDIHRGDVRTALATLHRGHYHCVVTSPPYYWQRDYKVAGQIGQEWRIEEYVQSIADSMDGVYQVLRKDGLLFLNLGDTYYSGKGQPKGKDRKNGARRFGLRAVDASGLGVPQKTAIGIPWRVALEMIKRGWTLRSPIVWRREGSLPEPTARDRPWRTYEFVFMFSKSRRYYFAREHLPPSEDVWTISERPTEAKGVHSAAFPDELVHQCLAVGCPDGGRVLDPFAGTGTVVRVSVQSGRPATGLDLICP
jgi:DNA modification methylase